MGNLNFGQKNFICNAGLIQIKKKRKEKKNSSFNFADFLFGFQVFFFSYDIN